MVNKYTIYKMIVVSMLCGSASYCGALVFGFKQIKLNPVECKAPHRTLSILVDKNSTHNVRYVVETEDGSFFKEQLNNGVFEELTANHYRIFIINETSNEQRMAAMHIPPVNPVSIISTVITHVTERGATNGSLSIVVTGGTGMYRYELNGIPSNSPDFTNLPPHSYSARVFSSDGSCDMVEVVITEPFES
ncbi:SprB repeat-containing protein [Candidatus Dependentiae bacterium]|nr:SprB repeat-containing protein [Candidatus Dependentiae bacterium]